MEVPAPRPTGHRRHGARRLQDVALPSRDLAFDIGLGQVICARISATARKSSPKQGLAQIISRLD
jgi:hypothetical protein